MEEWAVFTDKETGQELAAYTIRGTFPGARGNGAAASRGAGDTY